MSSVLKSHPLTSSVFIVVIFLSAVSAQKNLALSRQSDLESMEEFQDLLRKVQLVFEMKMASNMRQVVGGDSQNDVAADPNLGCTCSGLKCSCCHYISIWTLGLYGDCCLSVSFHPHNLSVLIDLKFGSHELYAKEVSASHPPPICHHFPFEENGVSGCIQFYNLGVNKWSFKGCARLLIQLLHVTVFKYDLGCFKINVGKANRYKWVPYLERGRAPVNGPEPLYYSDYLMEKIKSGN